MAGRPKLPVAIKKQRGTFRNYDKDQEKQEEQIKAVLPAGKLKISKEITDPAVKKAYKAHVEMLNALGGAAVQTADNPLLEYAYKCLQLSKETEQALKNLDVGNENYFKASESLSKQFRSYFQEFERIAKEFYLTPTARAKLKLDVLTATEKEQNIEKNKSVIASLLEKKQS